jgi:protein gp37
VGYKTKIDWCDSSWNPVTGCQRDCEYCYARSLANRYGGFDHDEDKNPVGNQFVIGVQELDKPKHIMRKNGLHKAPYPWFFLPTLHRYRLDQPSKWSEPRTIFVCSMADLFGKWVPDEWIEAVINACIAAPQHRYLFLTKNPARYMHLIANGIIPENQPNFWFGSTATIPEMEFFWCDEVNTFVSIEPILAPFEDLTDEGVDPASKTNWIIVGAETGNRKNKVVPQKSWIDEIVSAAKKAGTPVFMKESLREIMGDDFRQEFPWEVRGYE